MRRPNSLEEWLLIGIAVICIILWIIATSGCSHRLGAARVTVQDGCFITVSGSSAETGETDRSVRVNKEDCSITFERDDG